MSPKEWILLLVFLTICILADSISSLQLILYPPIAESKGTTAFEYTIVFGIYTGTIALVCPFVENIINSTKIHPKWLFSVSVFISCFILIGFGLVVYIENRTLFIATSIILQILKGIFAAIDLVSSYTLIGLLFPKSVSKSLMGCLDASDPMGSVVGPIFGSLLFSAGGFPLPFITLACLLGILAGILILLTHTASSTTTPNFSYNDDEEENAEENESENLLPTKTKTDQNDYRFKILKQPKLLVSFTTICIAEIVLTFASATIEPYLRKEFNASSIQSGLVISISSLTALISPVFGYYNFKKPILDSIIFFGAGLQLVGVLFIGPIPLPISASYSLTLGAMVLINLGANLIVFPSFLLIIYESECLGFKHNNKVITRLSGIYQTITMVGRMIGPPISGILYDNYGFRNAETFCMIVLGILMVYNCWVLIKDFFGLVTHEK